MAISEYENIDAERVWVNIYVKTRDWDKKKAATVAAALQFKWNVLFRLKRKNTYYIQTRNTYIHITCYCYATTASIHT